MKIFIKILFLLCCMQYCNAAPVSLNTTADKYFTDSAYKKIIYNQFLWHAKNKGISFDNFSSNYDRLEDSLITIITPLAKENMSKIEKKVIQQKNKKQQAMSLFESAIKNAVNQSIQNESSLMKSLAEVNFNDRILSFDSKIKIDKSGLVHVTENIKIKNCEDFSGNYNNNIKRGITRDIPTIYSNKYGLIEKVNLKIESITRNGEKENFRLENLQNGIRIFCGQSDKFLEKGNYLYTIKYTTDNQLKNHDNRDEFYWNVTGNGWDFNIGKSSCTVEFPEGCRINDISCYTGYQGSKDQDCSGLITQQNIASFSTTTPQLPLQGFTISASVDKGIILFPNKSDLYLKMMKDNMALCIISSFVLLLILRLYFYWRKVGKDPKKGVVYPQFKPPYDMSPADVGYLYHQSFSNKLFTAALIDLAVKNKIYIDVEKEGTIFKQNIYKFSSPKSQTNSNATNARSSYELYGFDSNDLFGMEIKSDEYNPKFKKIVSSFTNHVKSKILTENKDGKGFLSMNDEYIGAGLFLLVMFSIGAAIYYSITKPPTLTIIYAVIVLLIGFVFQIFFMTIIKSLTQAGRSITDEILGFKMYLETTDKHVLNVMNPPDEDIQLYEKYLPYAIALGIENKWSDRFKQIIDKSLADGYTSNYHSIVMHSNFSSSSSQSFASSFSSGLSNTVSSASTPPSSSGSSGSSGGGFSGGGGGGGGGGGW